MEQKDFEKNRESFDNQDLEKSDFDAGEKIKKEIFENAKNQEIAEKEKIEQKIKKETEKNQSPYQDRKREEKESEKIKKQSVQGKLRHFLDLAKTQGIVEAMQAVKKMNDPYLLDLFHDALAEQGLYKKSLKEKD
ncbi:MAG: hypothetical protein U9Q27_02725 [Patescibacteria group bacterium]|nr:hypothetical protein [Patescibacteria group bacterium]